MRPKGWHNRGYLPHYDGRVYQFITFRLHDSLPQTVLRYFEEEARLGSFERNSREFRIKIEEYLDTGMGDCILKIPTVAEIVENALFFYDGVRYRLIAWVIMPNHIHLLLIPLEGVSLSEIMRNLKGFTARMINKHLGLNGPVWQPDYFDRYIRDEDHYNKTVRYIENNPVNAKLVEKSRDWRFSSGSRRNQVVPVDE
ncbi:MAG: transposase [Pyrinomonadaceae bacterium]